MRLVAAVVAGAATASAAAVVLGDYPLSGSVPWIAALLIPFLIGMAMVLVAGRDEVYLWAATGPLSALSLWWGVRIATGWGLDPTPTAAWVAIAVGGSWPIGWAAVSAARRRRPGLRTATDARATRSDTDQHEPTAGTDTQAHAGAQAHADAHPPAEGPGPATADPNAANPNTADPAAGPERSHRS